MSVGKNKNRSLILKITTIITGTLLLTSFASAGFEAVELTNVPTDILANCNRTFFKSSNPKERALYVTPHVLAGRSPLAGGEKEIYIDPLPEKNKYKLVIGLFFPRDSGDNVNFYEMRDAQANYCNFEAVKFHLNNPNGEDDGDDSNNYLKIVQLPINDIAVSIPALGGRSSNPSRQASPEKQEGTTIFEYVDRSYTVEYEINEEELDEINRRMSRGTGMQVLVSFNFESRQNDGEVSVEIDARSVKAKLEAQAQGKPKFMGKLDLKAMLQTAIAESDVNIEVKGGFTEQSSQAIDRIVDKVIDNISFDMAPEEIPAGEFQPAGKVTGVVNVQAATKAIVSQLSQNFSYRQISAGLRTTIQVPTQVYSHPIDPDIKRVVIKDGFNSKDLAINVRAGESIRISPGFAFQSRRIWGEKRQYLTVGQIKDLGVRTLYDELVGTKYSYRNETDNLGTSGLAIDCLIGSWGYKLGMCTSYRFRRIQRFPVQEIRSNHFHYAPKTPADFFEIPIYVAFSKIDGAMKIFTLQSLIGDHEKFTGRIESESIVIDAKEDLGLMRVGDRFKKYDLPGNLRDSTVNNNDVIKIYTSTPEGKEKDKAPDLQEYTRADGSYIFSYRSDKVVLDEVLIDFHWGSRSSPKRLENLVEQNGLPIQNRIDYAAIKAYRGFVLSVSVPFDTPERDKIKTDIKGDDSSRLRGEIEE